MCLIFYVSIDKMPKPQLYKRSVLNTRPINMTLNLECSEEPLSVAQLMSSVKMKENYDRVSLSDNHFFSDILHIDFFSFFRFQLS